MGKMKICVFLENGTTVEETIPFGGEIPLVLKTILFNKVIVNFGLQLPNIARNDVITTIIIHYNELNYTYVKQTHNSFVLKTIVK